MTKLFNETHAIFFGIVLGTTSFLFMLFFLIHIINKKLNQEIEKKN